MFVICSVMSYAEITIHFDVIHVDSVYFEYTDCFTLISRCGRHVLHLACYFAAITITKLALLCNLVGKVWITCITNNKLAIYLIYVYWKLIYVLSTTCVLSGEMCDCLFVYSVFNGRNGLIINIVNTGFC